MRTSIALLDVPPPRAIRAPRYLAAEDRAARVTVSARLNLSNVDSITVR